MPNCFSKELKLINLDLSTAEQAGMMVTHFANGFYPHNFIATLIGSLFGGG